LSIAPPVVRLGREVITVPRRSTMRFMVLLKANEDEVRAMEERHRKNRGAN
jgi:hypothetical protein